MPLELFEIPGQIVLKYDAMSNLEFPPSSDRNPVTRKRHRREVLLQITVPVSIGAIILLVLAVLVTQGGASNASVWADISLIWLIIPVLIFSLILAIFMAGITYAVVYLIGVLPYYFYQAHEWLIAFGIQVKRAGDTVVEPIIRVQAFNASLRSLGRRKRRE